MQNVVYIALPTGKLLPLRGELLITEATSLALQEAKAQAGHLAQSESNPVNPSPLTLSDLEGNISLIIEETPRTTLLRLVGGFTEDQARRFYEVLRNADENLFATIILTLIGFLFVLALTLLTIIAGHIETEQPVLASELTLAASYLQLATLADAFLVLVRMLKRRMGQTAPHMPTAIGNAGSSARFRAMAVSMRAATRMKPKQRVHLNQKELEASKETIYGLADATEPANEVQLFIKDADVDSSDLEMG